MLGDLTFRWGTENGSRPGSMTGRGGFSLLELIIAVAALAMALTGVSALLSSSMQLRRSNDDSCAALEAIASTIDAVKSTPLSEAFQRFNATTADDPVAGASPGAGFAVLGLEPVAGDVDGLVGEVFFPGDGLTLREDFVDRELGMPRDLNEDGPVDNLDHALDYHILPLRVRLVWQGPKGIRRLELVTTLSD